MPPYFTVQDLSVFDIPAFAERMLALKSIIRPKLEAFGEKMAPILAQQFDLSFFPHVAKHMRRKVNPPDETWVAFGPNPRSYKSSIFFALCVGKGGAQARVVMKDESPTRPELGENFLAHLSFLEKNFQRENALGDYSRCPDGSTPLLLSNDFENKLRAMAEKLKTQKTALFDVGIPLQAGSKNLEGDFLKMAAKLFPFYRCGLEPKVRLA